MLPSHREIQTELRKFIRINTFHGLMLYAIDMGLYVLCIYGVLFLPEIWMKAVAGTIAGFKIANLATIAHDAAHNSLTKSRWLNKYLAITSFLPGLFNYELWLYDHHRLHHSRTNEDFPDSYTPMSKAQYDAASPLRKWKERLYRKPSFVYFGLYYIVERWSKVKLFPTRHMPRKIHAPAWRHFALITTFATGFLALLACAPLYSETGSVTAIVLGFVVPFYIFQTLFAFTVYVQHTHPDVAWFDTPPDRSNGQGRQEYISVHLEFPKWLKLLVHNVYDHGAHHVCPAIPCYELHRAQKRLNELLGDYAVSDRFTFEWLFNTMRTCRLYDYVNHCWLDYDGTALTASTLVVDNADLGKAEVRKPVEESLENAA